MSRKLAAEGKGRYAFLLFDATFKVVVCTPENEKLLIEIIELLIPGKHISSITFVNKEMHGLVIEEKNVNFDLLCKDDETGEEFLVEVQNAGQKSYRDRMLFYATYPIREQMAVRIKQAREDAERVAEGKKKSIRPMDYSLKPVYVISMVNFDFAHEDDGALEQDYISRYEIRNGQNGELLTPSLNFVFLEMARLPWGPEEGEKCKTLLERFIFSMKNMHMLTERPKGFDDPLLKHLYEATELGSMTVTKRQNYDKIMFTEIDRIAQMEFAREEGEKRGEEKGRDERQKEIVRNLLQQGIEVEKIVAATGLCKEEVLALK